MHCRLRILTFWVGFALYFLTQYWHLVGTNRCFLFFFPLERKLFFEILFLHNHNYLLMNIWDLGNCTTSSFFRILLLLGASQVAMMIKNPPANAGDIRDAGSIPGLGKSCGGGHGNPPQYSCLENPLDREAWRSIGSQKGVHDWSDLASSYFTMFC